MQLSEQTSKAHSGSMWSFAADDDLDPKNNTEKQATLEYLQSKYFLKSFFIRFIYFLFTVADFPTLSNNSTCEIPPLPYERYPFRAQPPRPSPYKCRAF